MKKKIIVLTADANTLVYHRGDLIRDFARAGYEVISSAAEDYPHVQDYLKAVGGRHRAIRMIRSRVNPFADLITWWDMWQLFRTEKPDLLFAYTIKSVVYGCVIARLAGVPRIVALLPGLGFTFVKQTTLKGRLLSFISHALHRLALRVPEIVFVQNQDDLALLRQLRMIPPRTPIHVCAGSGVNVQEFHHAPMEQDENLLAGRIRFVLVSRLLISKGVAVWAEAARRVKARHPQAEFHLVGPFDPNPNRITEEQVAGWVQDGVLTHHGMVKDVPQLLATMHVFCLPTWYREGVPHAGLEGLSMGKAMIMTDSVGARECVAQGAGSREQGAGSQEQGEALSTSPQRETENGKRKTLPIGKNGILVQPQSVEQVEQAMEHYLAHPQLIPLHGRESRRLAEEVFDVRVVNRLMLQQMGLEQL